MIIEGDVAVLGAGIVGVSTALHLQSRGRSVVLVDRREPGEEASYGNAGLIERSSVIPYAFPRDLLTLLRLAVNQSGDVRYDWRHLPAIAPWLFQYWRHSSPRNLARAAREMLPLVERSVSEHVPLLRDAGASQLARHTGWLELCHSRRSFQVATAQAAALKDHNLAYGVLRGRELRELEPGIDGAVFGAIHWLDPVSVSSPGEVTKAYARLFLERGGRFIHADARSLRFEGGAWTVGSNDQGVRANEAVIALGSWSVDVTAPLGYRIPVAVKRGYHMHFEARGGISLGRPVVSARGGFVLSPMLGGIRLTTGVELAPRDAEATPVQLDRAERIARNLIPLGPRTEERAWLGARPCLPDMKPIIGSAGRHPGLWFNFGHAHHGFTLGPVSGRLLAEQMTGQKPVTDPAPYRADRFGFAGGQLEPPALESEQEEMTSRSSTHATVQAGQGSK